MKKSKIIVDFFLIDKISSSIILDDNSKISFLKYIWYLNKKEREELLTLI